MIVVWLFSLENLQLMSMFSSSFEAFYQIFLLCVVRSVFPVEKLVT